MGKTETRILVTVLGRDKVGIIAAVTGVLATAEANILDISQTIMQEFFVMIMLVDMSTCSMDFDSLRQLLVEKGKEIGVQVNTQREDVFRYMHRI
ncbi:MAG: ACT domain-containing protein [Syntrophomonadaceae bacterium]|nr:ACT domain-containing protein [Syntrophomonadaceae bacterium]